MTDDTPPRDIFPRTMRTWIGRRLDEGTLGRAEINRHIMSVYAHPLKVYYLGSSLRWLGEPDEIVQGFFASRLAREQFLRDWSDSGLRLRRWLMNALLFYLKEVRRRRQRDEQRGDAAGADESVVRPDASSLDRAWAASIVREAWSRAAESCAMADLATHWAIFIRHHVQGQPYADLASAFDVSAAQAAVMSRTARNRFRDALRECVIRDGANPDEADREIRDLLEIVSQ